MLSCFFKIRLLSVWCLLIASGVSFAQLPKPSPEKSDKIRKLVTNYKSDARGPYLDIRWFCNDGTTKPPKEPCGAIGGVQRARYKPEVIQLAKEDHVYLGQILSTTGIPEFWDASNFNSRLKQYQIEKYLKSIDDGWINRKAQYYRGAVQAEDEEAWGRDFFNKTLNDQNIAQQFYLLREAAKDLPHRQDDNIAQLMRSQSKAISDQYSPFMNLRIKIHNNPDSADIVGVIDFKKKNLSKLSPQLQHNLDQLVATMEAFFKPLDLEQLMDLASPVTNAIFRERIRDYVGQFEQNTLAEKLDQTSDLMWLIRERLAEERSMSGRLALLDISIQLERMLLAISSEFSPQNLNELMRLIFALSKATAATGYLEIWEWQAVETTFSVPSKSPMERAQIMQYLQTSRRLLEWSVGMCKAVYEPQVRIFESFEPNVLGFIDNRIRGSVALILGVHIGALGDFLAASSAMTNKVFSIPNQSHIRGLNPGYATGVLNVVSGGADHLEVNPQHIYLFEQPPPDLKPVAGIATVSEGNLVSHVQLLARNLGIPNAGLSPTNFNELKKYHGKTVFYAVSNGGNVIMKLSEDMTKEEKSLFANKTRSEEIVSIPVDQIDLTARDILPLKGLRANASGRICGPKAANLGELKTLFPDNVVEGLVIPFGTFYDHMQQTIPGDSISYWQYLNSVFDHARKLREAGQNASEIEAYQLEKLGTLNQLIKSIPLKESFKEDLKNKFSRVFGSPLGSVGVFLRSDTNMEDLKDFSGAGLNLTLFNVLDSEEIFGGIKRVWASPYTERSFKWRQAYLNNPENVYPSILIVPSVNNDFSGVVVTKNFISGNSEEIIVALSRGVGGAVEGQAAETWVLGNNTKPQLLSPAREPFYSNLPQTGGTNKMITAFNQQILSEENSKQIGILCRHLKQVLPEQGITGPYDVELGFKDDKLWLFQVRPFVENKRAVSSEYLQSITPKINVKQKIDTSTPL